MSVGGGSHRAFGRRSDPERAKLELNRIERRRAHADVRKILARAGQLAGLPFAVHLHMLRHACGYKLANDGHDTRATQHYLGHRNIVHTVRYTELASDRFKGFWGN